jgi:hypothetical protein
VIFGTLISVDYSVLRALRFVSHSGVLQARSFLVRALFAPTIAVGE